jgi:hypothetical protein
MIIIWINRFKQRHSSYSGSMPWQIVRAQAKLRSTKLTMLSVLREKICSSDFSIFSLEGVGMCQPDKHGKIHIEGGRGIEDIQTQ